MNRWILSKAISNCIMTLRNQYFGTYKFTFHKASIAPKNQEYHCFFRKQLSMKILVSGGRIPIPVKWVIVKKFANVKRKKQAFIASGFTITELLSFVDVVRRLPGYRRSTRMLCRGLNSNNYATRVGMQYASKIL